MKTKIKALSISTLIVLLMIISGLTFAQVSYKLDSKKSSMVVKGTSTIHDWEMNVEGMKGSFTLQKDHALSQLTSGDLVVDVESIKSEHSLMNKKTYDALKDDDYPQIKAKLVQVEQNQSSGKVNLEISIAGRTKTIEDNFQIKNDGSNVLEIKGVLNLKMSDFDVEPPVALMGTIKTGDEISVEYNLVYEKAGQLFGEVK